MSTEIVVITQETTPVVEVEEAVSQTVIATAGPPGPRGLPGPPGGSVFEFEQSTPASQWNITHNFGRRPNVSVLTTSGVVMIVRIEHEDENSLRVVSNSPIAGTALLS